MSLETKHFIKDIEIRPENADTIGFKFDWTGDILEAELSVDSILLVTDAKKIVLDHIATLGIYEGIPYRAEVFNPRTGNTVTLEYFIDLTDNPTISGAGDSAIEVKIMRRKAVDWFKKNANGLSFELVNKRSAIPVIDIPYVIIPENIGELLIMLTIMTLSLYKALLDALDVLEQAVKGLVGAIANLIASPLSAANVLRVVFAVLRLAVAVLYVALIVIALIDTVTKIIQTIFPSIRNFKGTYFKTLLESGCAHLNYTFSSQLIDAISGLTHLPVPMRKTSNSIWNTVFGLENGLNIKGYPTANDTTPTLGTLIDALEIMLNAKLRVTGSVVHLERRDFWANNAGVTIKNTLNIQSKRENEWTYNLGETWKRYYLHYLIDQSDTHTLDNIEGTGVEYSTEPVTVVNADLVNITGLADMAIPFAHGVRKNNLNKIEEEAKKMAKFADNSINLLGGNSNLVGLIDSRIGVTQISQQYFTVSKILYTVNGRQPENYLDVIGANPVYNNYHIINQVKENFKRIYSSSIPFSTDNFETFLDSNYVNDEDGSELEVLTMEWINESKTAQLEYAVLSDEGFNTKTDLIDG